MAGEEEPETLGARERMCLKLHSNNVLCVAMWSLEDVVRIYIYIYIYNDNNSALRAP